MGHAMHVKESGGMRQGGSARMTYGKRSKSHDLWHLAADVYAVKQKNGPVSRAALECFAVICSPRWLLS